MPFLRDYFRMVLFFIFYNFAIYVLTCSVIIFDNYQNNKQLLDLPAGFSLNLNFKP